LQYPDRATERTRKERVKGSTEGREDEKRSKKNIIVGGGKGRDLARLK
jgi:hypothetical protein